MFEHLKPNTKATFAPTNTEISPETGVLNTDEMLGQDPNQNGGLPVMSAETIENAQPPEQSAERPDDPAAIEPKAPLAEAESLLAWLKTQPSTPENKAMRAQAGVVVDYLKAK